MTTTEIGRARAFVKEAIAEHPNASVQEIAFYAAAAVPARQLRDCLAEALVDMARILVGNGRRESMDNALGGAPNSPKMRDRASWWAQMLTERVNVGGELKALGDCTVDDLDVCIGEREKLITRISDQVENYKRLQKLMVQHGAKSVAEIPPQKEWK